MKNNYMVEVNDGLQVYKAFWEGYTAQMVLREVKDSFDEIDFSKVVSIKVYRIEKFAAAGYEKP